MIHKWADYEGRSAGAWPLDSFLGVRDNAARYLTRKPQDGSKALIELVPAGAGEASAISGSWQLASQLGDHDLLPVEETGEAMLDEEQVLYAVLPVPNDDIGEIMAVRALDLDEARALTSSAANALNYLHGRGLRHGAVLPSSIFIVGEAVKLGVNTIAPAGEGGKASDLRQFGTTLVQAFTRETNPEAARSIPAPFREIAAGCLEPPGRQWTPQRILDALDSRVAAQPRPAPVPVRSRRVEPEDEPGRRWLIPAAAVLTLVALFGYWFSRSPASSPARANSMVAEPARAPIRRPVEKVSPTAPPVVAETAPVQEKPSPLKPPVSARARQTPPVRGQADRVRETGAGGSSWAVIAATYSNFGAAKNRAEHIAKSSPHLRAHVYPPEGRGERYYVVLGSGLTQPEAERLLRTAHGAGAPHDTYVTKLKEN